MSLTRRLLMRALPAAPVMAKAAVAKEAAELANVSTALAGVADLAGRPTPFYSTTKSILAAIKAGLVKREDVLRELERSAYVSQIDPDLAAMKSFSLDAKFRAQRRRNAERDLAASEQGLGIFNLAERFEKIFEMSSTDRRG